MTTSVSRWDPFQELANMRGMFDRMLDGNFPRIARSGGDDFTAGGLGLDVYETNDEYVVKAAVPGVEPKDVEIEVEDDVLTIRGESRHSEEVTEDQFLRRELRWGRFERSLRLPPTVDAENAHAAFENGMLRLSLPKRPEAKSKTIKITPQGVSQN